MKNWIVLLVALTFALNLQARDAREDKRIEFLLQSVETMKGGVFIRNGSEYNGQDAVKHLRRKLDAGGERVKTAEDFIVGCATKSSFSGKPYQIRMPDGKTVETATFFKEELRDYDRDHTPK